VLVGDGPARAQLQGTCPEALLVGSKTGDDLAVHYASADVFVFPSLTETFGNVTPEAMASGLPVLAYDYAAAAQLIHSGESGLLAPCKDAQRFDQLAEQLAADPARAALMGAAARTAAEQLDWASVLDKVEALAVWRADELRPMRVAELADILARDPDDATKQRNVAVGQANVARAELALGHLEQAKTLHIQASQTFQALCDVHDLGSQLDWAAALALGAEIARDAGDAAEGRVRGSFFKLWPLATSECRPVSSSMQNQI
jgi:hypothetical protein